MQVIKYLKLKYPFFRKQAHSISPFLLSFFVVAAAIAIAVASLLWLLLLLWLAAFVLCSYRSTSSQGIHCVHNVTLYTQQKVHTIGYFAFVSVYCKLSTHCWIQWHCVRCSILFAQHLSAQMLNSICILSQHYTLAQ